MPRDPKDISIGAVQRTQRRLGEFDDQKDPIRLRTGTGPAGADGKSFRGNEALSVASEVGTAPGELVNRLTVATGVTVTLKKLNLTAANLNQVITLHKLGTGTLTVKDGENLKLAGEFVLSENDTLTLICDGTNWIEIGRANT